VTNFVTGNFQKFFCSKGQSLYTGLVAFYGFNLSIENPAKPRCLSGTIFSFKASYFADSIAPAHQRTCIHTATDKSVSK